MSPTEATGDTHSPPPVVKGHWERWGKFAVISTLIVALLGSFALENYLRADHIYTNMGSDFLMGATVGFVVCVIAWKVHHSLFKDEKTTAKEESAGVLTTDMSKPIEPPKKSKMRMALFVIGAVSVPLAIIGILFAAGYYGIGHALIGGDQGAAFLSAMNTLKEAFISFYQHTFQPLGDFLKQYLEQNGEAFGMGAASMGVGVLLLYSAVSIHNFFYPSKKTVEVETRGRSGSTVSVLSDTEIDEHASDERQPASGASGAPIVFSFPSIDQNGKPMTIQYAAERSSDPRMEQAMLLRQMSIV